MVESLVIVLREGVEAALVVVTQDPEVAGIWERMVFLEHRQTAREVPCGKHALLSPLPEKARAERNRQRR